jgi:hypothetical protein
VNAENQRREVKDASGFRSHSSYYGFHEGKKHIKGSKAVAHLAFSAFLSALSVGIAPASPVPVQPAAQSVGRWRDSSLDDYRKHLVELTSLVDACAKARDLKTCDPALVGPDDRVPLSISEKAERRLVRYGWLRVLFSKAEDPDEQTGKSSSVQQANSDNTHEQPNPPTSQLLKDAEKRLVKDLAQATAPFPRSPAYDHERETMKAVLAGPDFRYLEQPTVEDTMLEKVANWLNHLFEAAAKVKARSAWVGLVIVIGFILVVCAGLAWGILQLERRWRVRLLPESEPPVSGAASARDWQLWLEDARRAATRGHWREAIHFVYWASISRLESKRLWPADRARTPREYLSLVGSDDPRKAQLASLTRTFESVWYGGRHADEADYRKAEALATALGASSSRVGTADLSAVTEGGAI